MKLAIITDIHEDILSLKEALRRIEKYGVDEIVCLGDISGYSVPHYAYLKTRNAHECLSLIRKNCKIVVIGNHDFHSAQIIPQKCSFFDFPDNWYQLDYHERLELANNILWLHEENDLNPLYKAEDIKFLKTLPEYSVLNISGLNILFTHYVYPNISGLKKEFYTYGDEFQQHFQFMNSLGCNISFTGHSHVKGFFTATGNKFKQYRYKKIKLNGEPTCIGIPPITALEKRIGFCIFNTKDLSVEMVKI
jgi:predicted phosphodiesterase